MAGLQTLMQTGQMPGQAGAFSVMPAQQGKNPVEYTRSLKQLPPEDLIRLYNDPNDLRPKWAVASAYADAMKARAMQRGMQGQQAMAQNSQEQQQPPVADQVMSVMAANGGEMKAYKLGGDVDEDDLDNIVAEADPQFGGSAVSAETDAARVEEIRRDKIRQQYRDVLGVFNSPTAAQRILDENPWLKQEVSPAPNNPAGQQNTASTATSGRRTETRRETKPEPTAESPAAGLGAIDFKGKTPYEQALQAEAEKLVGLTKKRGEVTPEMAAARSRVEQARARQLEQGQQDIGKIREEGIRQLQGRLDRAKMPLIEDAEALLSMAAAINPQKGKVIGSLASGVSNVLADRRARAEKAEEGIFTLNEKIRLLNSQYQEAAALEEQRKYSILTGDIEGQRNAEIEGAKVMMDVRKTQASIRATLEEAEAKKQAAGASREDARVRQRTNALTGLANLERQREAAYNKAKEEWLNTMPIKTLQINAMGDKANPAAVTAWQNAQRDFDRQFNQRAANLDNAIGALRREAGMPGDLDLSQWGADVKVEATPAK
jgi:hypothetical protein